MIHHLTAPDYIANDAINSETNDEVMELVIGRSACKVSGCGPGVPGYSKTGVQSDIHNS